MRIVVGCFESFHHLISRKSHGNHFGDWSFERWTTEERFIIVVGRFGCRCWCWGIEGDRGGTWCVGSYWRCNCRWCWSDRNHCRWCLGFCLGLATDLNIFLRSFKWDVVRTFETMTTQNSLPSLSPACSTVWSSARIFPVFMMTASVLTTMLFHCLWAYPSRWSFEEWLDNLLRWESSLWVEESGFKEWVLDHSPL